MRQDSFSLTDFFNFVLSYYCCTRGSTLRHLQKFFQCILVKFTSPSFSFIPPHPLLRTVSAGLIFRFHTWVHSSSTTSSLLHPFLISSPLPLVQINSFLVIERSGFPLCSVSTLGAPLWFLILRFYTAAFIPGAIPLDRGFLLAPAPP
jgi:hypothetical protein